MERKRIGIALFENCPSLNILVVPGGWGTRKELNNPVMLEWLRICAAEVETLTSFCLYRIAVAGFRRAVGWAACNHSLALVGLDARFSPSGGC